MIQTDVCILGAGPGGAAAALRLDRLGIRSVLVDKAAFPRDKVCGDGLTNKVVTLLERIDPELLKAFDADKKLQVDSWGVTMVNTKGAPFHMDYRKIYRDKPDKTPAYVSKRMDFDNFLVEAVRRSPLVEFYENVNITQHERQADGSWIIRNKENTVEIAAKLLIVANGVQSPFARHVAGIALDPKHHAGAVRAYYKGVEGLGKEQFLELHFLKNYLPGYFWIFPLPNGEANVGIGLLTERISARKLNLRKALAEVIENEPNIKQRFANATLVGEVVGYPLPLGSKRRKLFGDAYMLVGDAGYLVDPLTGEGIGNALYSGLIAAEQAQTCIAENRYDAAFLKAYETRVFRVMGTELQISTQLQKMLRHPWLFDTILRLTEHNAQFSDLIYSMFNDINLRKRLFSPVFWYKLVFNKK
jgi:menaquinone-9 beta-reductase